MDYQVVEDGVVVKFPLAHPQVLPFFPSYRLDKPAPGIVTKYFDVANCVGHQQRSWLTDYCWRALQESGGGVGADLGSAGVQMPGCLSMDIVGNGETPEYGGTMSGVHIKRDAANLSLFGDNMLSCIVNNHTIEHLSCRYLRGNESPQKKIIIHCPGLEVLDVVRFQWLRVIRPGGYLCIVFPEEGAAQRAGHSVFHEDKSHQHAWLAANFYRDIIVPLVRDNLIEVLEFDTFDNAFSCNFAARKK